MIWSFEKKASICLFFNSSCLIQKLLKSCKNVVAVSVVFLEDIAFNRLELISSYYISLETMS